jgi:hypothetical protein
MQQRLRRRSSMISLVTHFAWGYSASPGLRRGGLLVVVATRVVPALRSMASLPWEVVGRVCGAVVLP